MATDRALIGIHGGTPWRPKGVAAATDPTDQFFRGGVHDAFRSGLLPTGDGFRQTVEPCRQGPQEDLGERALFARGHCMYGLPFGIRQIEGNALGALLAFGRFGTGYCAHSFTGYLPV